MFTYFTDGRELGGWGELSFEKLSKEGKGGRKGGGGEDCHRKSNQSTMRKQDH